MSPGLLLAFAIAAEVLGTSALRQSDGFSKAAPVAVMLGAYVFSLYLLSVIVRDVPIGITYAIWAGCGTALMALVGVVAFKEPLAVGTIGGIGLVIVGVVVINITASSQ